MTRICDQIKIARLKNARVLHSGRTEARFQIWRTDLFLTEALTETARIFQILRNFDPTQQSL